MKNPIVSTSHTSEDYNIQYNLCEIMYNWCNSDNEQACKLIFMEAKKYGIFLGEFTKAILKINAIAKN